VASHSHLTVSTHSRNVGGRVASERWLGQLGIVSGITYTWNNPGGPATFGCKLLCDPHMRHTGLTPGRVLTVWAGGSEMWRGTLDEPTPADDGWTLSATGIGSAGNDAVAYDNPSNAYFAQQEVEAAIARGALPWKSADTYPLVWATAERGSISITDTVDFVARFSNGGRWTVDVNGQLDFPAAFTQHTRFLAANTPGGGRTLEAYANALVAKYQIADQSYGYRSRFNQKSIDKHGRREEFVDLSSAGITTAANVDAALDAMIARYGHRARWSGSFACARGMVLLRGGVPEEPCAVRPNNMFRMQIIQPDFGGEVEANELQFVGGETSYDADSDVVTITPQESARRSLQDVLVNPKITKKA
jgi:hypothetical protein